MIIGLTGTNSSGKGTIADYFKKTGFSYYSLSDELREILKFRGVEPTRDNLVAAGNEMREKFGNGYLAERALRKIKNSAIVDSIRNLGEVDALRKRDDFILIAVDAPVNMRYERAKARGRVGEGEAIQQFIEKEKRELKGDKNSQNIGECMLEADHTIMNNSNIASLNWQLEILLEKIMKRGELIGKQTAKLG